jgi:hypothetical protein
VGVSARTVIGNGNVLDIAWDATDSLLLASRTTSFAGETFVAALDPTSGAQVSATAVGPIRKQLAVSDQDQFVYAFTPDTTSPPTSIEPQRYSLPGLSNGLTLTGFVTSSAFDTPPSQPLAPAPGAPATVAILTGASSTTVAIVDGAVARTKTDDTSGVGALEWGFDASTLYGIGPFVTSGLVRFTVDGTGVVSHTTLGSTTFRSRRLHFDRITRRLYGDSGENVNEQGVDSRPFTVLPQNTAGCVAAIDGALAKAFFACVDREFGLTVQSFDLATQKLIANVLLGPATVQRLQRIVRFGSDGVAVAADWSIYIYKGPFVQ